MLVSAATSANVVRAQGVSLGGPGGFEVLSNFERSDAWVTDARGRATGRPPWAVAHGWQVLQIPGSGYDGPHEDQFLLPRGAFVLHVRVHDASFPSRILVHGRTGTQSPLAPIVCFYLVEPLEGATLSLRFASGEEPRTLRLAVDRGSDGKVDGSVRPSAVVARAGLVDADYDGPRLTVTGRSTSAGVRVSVAAADRAGLAGIWFAIGSGPLARYRRPFVTAPDARIFVLAGDGLGNTSVLQRRAASLARG